MTAPPELAMLWETVNPADALTTRFGFTDAAATVRWLGEALWNGWSLRVDDCERLVMSAGNLLAWITADGRRLIAKWSVVPSLFEHLAETDALTTWLHGRGIPVAAPLPTIGGLLRVVLHSASLAVYPLIEGSLLDADDPVQVTEAGHMLATLQIELASYPHPIDGGQAVHSRQLVHNDFRSANILHDGTKITAVLDFDEATYQTRIADLAKATVLLGTGYRNWAPTSQPVRDAFVSAYRDHMSMSRAEEDELLRRIAEVSAGLGWRTS